MPVPGDPGRIGTDDFEKECSRHGVGEASCLFGSSNSAMGPTMQSANRESGSRRSGESQLLLDYEVSTERNDEEYAKETSSYGKKDQLSCIFPGRI